MSEINIVTIYYNTDNTTSQIHLYRISSYTCNDARRENNSWGVNRVPCWDVLGLKELKDAARLTS